MRRTLSLILQLSLAAALAPAPAPAAAMPAACQRAAATDKWDAELTASYSSAASDEMYAGEHRSSGAVTVTFGHWQDFGDHVWWQATAVTGSGSYHDRETVFDPRGDGWLLTEGGGPPAHWTANLYLDKTDCTYDMEVAVSITTTATSSVGGEPDTSLTPLMEFELHGRPVDSPQIAAAAPTLGGSAALPVWIDGQLVEGRDEYRPYGAGAGRVNQIRQEQGATTSGAAAVSWAARPSGQPRLAGVLLRQPAVPEESWVQVPQAGTVDGNLVQIIAQVASPLSTPLQLPVRFSDAETGEELPGCQRTVALRPQGVTEVACFWDTDGWGWDPARSPLDPPTAHPNRRIRVRLGADDNLYDMIDTPITVRARPVVMVHGLNSTAATWSEYPRLLHAANETWKGYAVTGLRTGEDILSQQRSYPLTANASILHDYVERVRELEQAWQVDIVAHSMGGLISRLYIHRFMVEQTFQGRPVVGRLVMLGTPNQGSLCAHALLGFNRWREIPNIHAPHELKPEVVAEFNRTVTDRRGVLFSVLAGKPLDSTCLFDRRPGDGVVAVPSAHHVYEDVGLTDSLHTDMTGSLGDFVSWVLPHLAVGHEPAGAWVAPPAAAPEPRAAPAQVQFTQLEGATVPAGGRVDVPLAVPPAAELSVTLVAAPGVSATLISPAGASVRTDPANSPAARQPFRGFLVDAPAAGRWVLRLESAGTAARPAMVVAAVSGSELQAEGAAAADAGGAVRLTLRLTRGGAPVAGAQVSARVARSDGSFRTIALADDGRSGDGAAGDGVYGARAAAGGSADGAVIQAVAGAETRLVSVDFHAPPAPGLAPIFLPLVGGV